MQAVVRETYYSPDKPIEETEEFQEFQQEHKNLDGYQGTVVVNAGEGRYLTLTLWDSAKNMNAARGAMNPVVERTVNPLASSPPKLVGTGLVVVNDLTYIRKE